MIKATLLYGHPVDDAAFEKYYYEIHLPIAKKMKAVDRMVFTKFVSDATGGKPAYYRMTDLYFADAATMQQTMASPEGQAAVADLANFATGGVTVLIGEVENFL
ncbi:MAG: EthD family reductase [Bacteroidetes bacterium]|nr:EthD family reductase [Bacteroidota bacterium]MBS1975505.1 EthD family reductase [Bacteroidota bacterium]